MTLLILCTKIFLARILDVSLGTVRTILTVKGKKVYASIVGFFEVLIWFSIVREALNSDSTSIFVLLSYALGFSTGTFIGGLLSDKFITGTMGMQVVLSKYDLNIIETIRNEGYAVSYTNIIGKDNSSYKYMLFIEVNKKRIDKLKKLIGKLDEKAFIVISETKSVLNGYFK